jgi:ATP:corrinoid adenosyltransferase
MERRVAWCGAFRSVIGGTGRDAQPDLLAAADLVTEMTKVEHPMDAGRKGEQGIEW